MLHLGAAMKVEDTYHRHPPQAWEAHSVGEVKTLRMSGMFPTPVSAFSINGSERTLFREAQ